MPTESTETKPAKTGSSSMGTDIKIDPEKPLQSPGISVNRTIPFQNGELKGYGFLSPELFKLRTDYDFTNGNTLGAYSNFKLAPHGLNLQEYGLNGAFNFAGPSRATANIDVNRPEQTIIGKFGVVNKDNVYSLDGKLNSETGALTNAAANAAIKFSDTVKANGNVVYDGVGQALTGKANVTEKENVYNAGVQVNTKTGVVNNANLDADVKFSNTVKGNGSVVYDGVGQTLTGKANVTEKENVYNAGVQVNTKTGVVNNANLDADVKFSNTVKGNGSVVYDGVGQTLTGKANVTEKENVYNAGVQVNTKTGVVNNANLDADVKFSNTVKGNGSVVYDGVGQTLTGKANVTEKQNIYNVNGQLNTATGAVNYLNGDAAVNFGNNIKGNGSVAYDGVGQTLTGKANVTEKQNVYNLGAQLNTATGTINNFNLGAAIRFSDSVKGTGSLTYDGIGQTLTSKASVTEKQNVYNVGGQINTATGSVNKLNADAAVMFSGTLKGTGSLNYDGIGKSLTAAVGVTDKQNTYNLNTQLNTATGRIDSFGADANIGFSKGAGAISLAAKTSGQMAELGAGVKYTSGNLNYSGQVKLNNESGALRFAEASAKLSTMSERNGNFSIEAGYRPNDAFVKVGYTISFGGGGSSSRKASAAPYVPMPFDSRALDAEVSSFRDKQAIALLKPADKKLYDQAAAGVEKLNAQGAGLPVEKTALALAVVANGKHWENIGAVELGGQVKNGQNIIIGNGPLNNPATEKAAANKETLANTPIAESAGVLRQQNMTAAIQQPASSPSLDNSSPTPKRAAQ
jgi:hypothetical protein